MTTHQTAECSIPDCYCHHASRQDAPLVQLPLVHEPPTSLSAANIKLLEDGFKTDWEQATDAMREDWESSFYWWLKGRQAKAVEVVRSDVDEMRRLVGERMER